MQTEVTGTGIIHFSSVKFPGFTFKLNKKRLDTGCLIAQFEHPKLLQPLLPEDYERK